MEKVVKNEAEWLELLSDEAFQVTRKGATEHAFTGIYNECKEGGVYHCVCCGHPLFSSEAKYDSRSGWPSYYQPISEDAVEARDDNSLLAQRTETICAKCDAHLGHVFPDGPEPTGLRYCMNSAALKLIASSD
jgi:peptide-methionine (R)-S-oxide reductase